MTSGAGGPGRARGLARRLRGHPPRDERVRVEDDRGRLPAGDAGERQPPPRDGRRGGDQRAAEIRHQGERAAGVLGRGSPRKSGRGFETAVVIGGARPPAHTSPSAHEALDVFSGSTANNRSSVSGVTTRVSARTLAYETSPQASAAAKRGSVPRARATRTRSRAAPGSSPTRQLSQAAHERNLERGASRAASPSRRLALSKGFLVVRDGGAHDLEGVTASIDTSDAHRRP